MSTFVAAEAERFLWEMYAERPELGDPAPRIDEARAEIAETGTYTHTTAELSHGARLAWRNNSRCIGRLYWNSLVVRDYRHVNDSAGVFDQCVAHLRVATNGGRIRPVVTVFAPDTPGGRGPRIRNDQLIRYAGWHTPELGRIGDPITLDVTREAERLGWRPTRTPFEVLPLIVDQPDGIREAFELPADAVLQVPISHPTLPWFGELGLRWYAVPALANMDLVIGGITYGCAPFSGWYMGTEIGARNLADVERYDMLPTIGKRMGADQSSERTLWRDRALVELNVAVLHSYEQAGVTMTDHHTESERFLTHLATEKRQRRTTPGDWSWLVPPMSGALSPVFHRYYDEHERCPAFTKRGAGCPTHGRQT